MIYDLQNLLLKMGAPEVREKGLINWHYFDASKKRLAGVAEIRLEKGGDNLIAELKHIRENVEDDNGTMHDVYVEHFYLSAERTARPGYYRITRMTFDGETYDKPKQAVIELGLGIFHARALDISVRMVEQTFNKQDILEKDTPVAPKAKTTTASKNNASMRNRNQFQNFLAQKETTRRAQGPSRPATKPKEVTPACVVIPFPARGDTGRIRA